MLLNNPLLVQLKKEIHSQKRREEGMVRYTDKGYALLEVSNKKRFIIPAHCLHHVFNGDRIIATIETQHNKPYAKPESLVETAQTQYVGQLKIKNQQLRFCCNGTLNKTNYPIDLTNDKKSDSLASGDWIVADLLHHPLNSPNNAALFIYKYKLADANDPLAYWYTSLVKNNLPHLSNQLEFSYAPNNMETAAQDLTHYPFFTIDGPETEDMDDAICILPHVDGQPYKIFVAIADPAAALPVDSQLDQDAKQRVMTLYLPRYTVSMLPQNLSNERCSLKPNKKRLTLVCEMLITEEGELQLTEQTRFFNAWITSQAKFSYEQLSDWLEEKGQWQPPANLIPSLRKLQQATLARINWRKKHNLIFQDKPDYTLVVNKKGELEKACLVHKRIANKLVEEMMIAANISAAHLFQQHQQTAFFNIHTGFDLKHLKQVTAILAEYNIIVQPEQLTSLQIFRDIMSQIIQLNDASLLYRIRRCYTYPEMAMSVAPHYCMGLPYYATWTSPMRKYSDLLNQRIIKAIIHKVTPPSSSYNYPKLLEHFAKIRKSARQTEKELTDYLYFNYLKKLNQTDFLAELIEINRFGSKVRLIENGAIAFIPLQQLKSSWGEVTVLPETGKIQIIGKQCYQLGEQIAVSIYQFNDRNYSILVKPT